MLKIFNKISNKFNFFFSSLNSFKDFKGKKLKFVFFSEGKSYQKYSKFIIDVLCEKYPNEVYYFSIDYEDKIYDQRVKNFFIDQLLIKYFFNNLTASYIFLTLTDLDNHIVKKNSKVDKYIYYFHSPISTTKSYTTRAFDNYDIIMCNANFQIEEIKAREKLNNLKKKYLIPTGYFYFDYLKERVNFNNNSNKILVAPSWNYNLKNFINENFIELIEVLLNKNEKVIFRPHPEHYKRSRKILEKIKNKFINQNFEFDESIENLSSMENSKCLITDNSGIAIEYVTVLKRPVLYFEEFDKIHNPEFKNYIDLKTIDDLYKKNFGYVFKKNEFYQIDSIIDKSIEEFKNKIPILEKFIKKNFSNYGETKKNFGNIIKKIF
jgi:hypothetical protein